MKLLLCYQVCAFCRGCRFRFKYSTHVRDVTVVDVQSKLCRGWLSGKVTREGAIGGSRVAWVSASPEGRRTQSHPDFAEFNREATWRILDLMAAIAGKHGAYPVPVEYFVTWHLLRAIHTGHKLACVPN